MKLQNFYIGQRVCSRKTGLPATGTVMGIVYAHFFIVQNPMRLSAYWTELYPDWFNKRVITVKFDSPTRPVNIFEFCKSSGSDPSSDMTKEVYEYHVNPCMYSNYPEEDLEPLD